jgi:hypothetical protein
MAHNSLTVPFSLPTSLFLDSDYAVIQAEYLALVEIRK